MALSRAVTFRPFFHAARPNASRPQLRQQFARRSYASGTDRSALSGNRGWALGAVAVIVPTWWYFYRPTSANKQARDEPDPFRTSGGRNTQSGKQEGLSNEDTRHPTDPTRPGISQKSEGPDSAKAKGTIDTQRPQP